MLIINEEPEEIIGENHICFFTEKEVGNIGKIQLHEVVELQLMVPNNPILYTKTITRYIKTLGRLDKEAAGLILLEAAQNNLK